MQRFFRFAGAKLQHFSDIANVSRKKVVILQRIS
jgi:hypothetical protein